MSLRRPFVVLTAMEQNFVSARSVADALARAQVPRQKVIAVFDEAALVNCRKVAAQMRDAPYVVIIGRAPAPQIAAQPSRG